MSTESEGAQVAREVLALAARADQEAEATLVRDFGSELGGKLLEAARNDNMQEFDRLIRQACQAPRSDPYDSWKPAR